MAAFILVERIAFVSVISLSACRDNIPSFFIFSKESEMRGNLIFDPSPNLVAIRERKIGFIVVRPTAKE